MKYVVLTIFPEMFEAFWAHGIVRRAIEHNIVEHAILDIRDFAEDPHQMTDDRPYGGGSGMVMKPEPLIRALGSAEKMAPAARTVLLTPQGQVFNQKLARRLAALKELVFVCGRYEGIDERVCQQCVDYEMSVGDYILSGGELAAMIVMEAVTRLLPGALGGEDAAEKDSFANGVLEHAHFTRPREFHGQQVPEVLLSGHHQEIEKWRHKSSLVRTVLKRPDLLKGKTLSDAEIEILEELKSQIDGVLKDQR
jgi:tRNA (guanine37-N1)-methyltransferase